MLLPRLETYSRSEFEKWYDFIRYVNRNGKWKVDAVTEVTEDYSKKTCLPLTIIAINDSVGAVKSIKNGLIDMKYNWIGISRT